MTETKSIKFGDKVKVIADYSHFHGKVGIVVNDYSLVGIARVVLLDSLEDKGSPMVFNLDEIEKV